MALYKATNFALCFRGFVVESGIFATREIANKHKRIAESERRARLANAPSYVDPDGNPHYPAAKLAEVRECPQCGMLGGHTQRCADRKLAEVRP